MQPRAVVFRGGGLGGGLGPRPVAPRGTLLGGQAPSAHQGSVCAAAGRADAAGELEWWKKRPGEDGWRPGDDEGDDGGYTRGSQGRQQRRDGSGYGRGGGGGGGRGRGGGGRQRQQRRPLHPWERGAGGRDEEDEDEGPGWWEVPRAEREAAERAAGPQPLDRWQEERLVVAFARGRRRVSVQQLAADLGLDRTEVTDWFKRHAARPKPERDAMEAPLSDQIAKEVAADEERRELERRKKAAKAAGGDAAAAAGGAWQQAPAAAPLGALLTPTKGPDTGYIPFAQRGRGGPGQPRRLAADALRTLESLYARSPYPSKDLLQSICDMHRLPRDVASEWFTQRREAEGRPHDPKAAKRLADQAARTAAAAAGDAPASAAGGKHRGGGAGAVPRGPLPGEEDELMRLMRAAAAEAAAAAAYDAPGGPRAARGRECARDGGPAVVPAQP